MLIFFILAIDLYAVISDLRHKFWVGDDRISLTKENWGMFHLTSRESRFFLILVPGFWQMNWQKKIFLSTFFNWSGDVMNPVTSWIRVSSSVPRSWPGSKKRNRIKVLDQDSFISSKRCTYLTREEEALKKSSLENDFPVAIFLLIACGIEAVHSARALLAAKGASI